MLITSINALATENPPPEVYTSRLMETAGKRFDRLDIEISVRVQGSARNANAGVYASMPIYSNKLKNARLEDKKDYIEEGLEYIAEYEALTEILYVMERHIKLYEYLAPEEGGKAIDRLLKIRVDMVEHQARLKSLVKIIEAHLEH